MEVLAAKRSKDYGLVKLNEIGSVTVKDVASLYFMLLVVVLSSISFH